MSKTNIYILSFNENSQIQTFIPVLWPSAKTYYEKYGQLPENYNWVIPTVEFLIDVDKVKEEISKCPPDIFAVSLYVWNYELTLEICSWVKETWPNCLVITGGPHQYFKHHNDWFIKHPFIDASLPSEVYGEIAIADMLNNYNNGKVDWNKVEQMVYPSKNRKMILKSPKATYKMEFKWDYSPFKEQYESIKIYVAAFNKIKVGALHCKIETTRGCPYECTFCDWGGGLGTKMLKKDIEFVKQDLDTLLSWNPSSIYVCDSNFGINGKRDVDIIKYIAEKKKESTVDLFPNVQSGGFAKTNKHFDYIKEILSIEAEHGLSYVYKISVQSFNEEVLSDIKRVDLRAEEHWELADYLKDKYDYGSTVELMFGLPGVTKDSWYNDFNVPYERNVYVRAYEWHLLPESEAYSPEYRKKYGVITSKKSTINKWSVPAEIVVGSSTLSREDYLEHMLSYCAYNFFVQTGAYKNTIRQVLKSKNIGFGEFLKCFVRDCFLRLIEESKNLQYLHNHLKGFVSEELNDKKIAIRYFNEPSINMLIWSYLSLVYFDNFDEVDPAIQSFLIDNYGCDTEQLKLESNRMTNSKNIGTSKRVGFFKLRYDNFKSQSDFVGALNRTYTYGNGDLLISRKTLL